MKQILLILILTRFCAIVLSQNQDWEVYIGLSYRDEGPQRLIEYYDYGYYIEGWIEDGKGWNVKTDINGLVLWDKILEYNNNSLNSVSVAADKTGNRYVCGHLTSTIGYWPFLVKFDVCGNKLWCKILNDFNLDYGFAVDIVINENNEIIVLCYYAATTITDNIFLAGFNENGQMLWKKPYASQNNNPWIKDPGGYSLKEFNGEYYIAGFCYWPYPDDTTHFFLRPLFIGIDSLFNEKWILPFHALDSIFGQAYYLTDLNDSVFIGVGDRWLEGINKNSIFMYFNKNGQDLGYAQIPNEALGPDVIANVTRKLVRMNDSLFMTLSVWSDTPDGKLGQIVIDTSGTIHNLHQGDYCYSAVDLIKTYNNKYGGAAEVQLNNSNFDIYLFKIDENLQPALFDTNQYTYDSLCNEQIQSGTIDLSDCLVWTGTEEIPSPEEYYSFIATIPITAFPNPAETEITLAFQNTDHHTNMLLECYNIYGQRIHSEKIWKGQQETRIDLQGWAKGLYFAVVKSEGKVAGTGRFVVR